MLPRPDAPVVTLRLCFAAGSAHDPPGQDGITALSAAWMAQATQDWDAQGLAQALFPLATSVEVHTNKETTTFHMTVHKDVAAQALPLLMDVVTRPRWDVRDFERVRAQQVQDVEQRLLHADDEDLGKEALTAFLWAGHPYGRPTLGTAHTLGSLTLVQVRTHASHVFTAQRLLLGLGGAYDPTLEQALLARVGALPQSPPDEQRPALPLAAWPQGRRIHIVQKGSTSTPINLGLHLAVNRAHPDFAALLLATSVLGEHRHMGGRLFTRMREERGLNYGDYAYVEHFEEYDDTTLAVLNIPWKEQEFTVWVRPVEEADALFALRLAVQELETWASQGITAQELEASRSFLLGYTLQWDRGVSRALGWAMDDVMNATPLFLPRLRVALQRLTLEQVNAAVRTHVHPQDLTVTLLAQDGPALQAQLLAGQASPRLQVMARGLSAQVLAADRVTQNWDLHLGPNSVTVTPLAALF